MISSIHRYYHLLVFKIIFKQWHFQLTTNLKAPTVTYEDVFMTLLASHKKRPQVIKGNLCEDRFMQR